MDCSVWIVFFYSTNREAWVVQGMECVPLIIRPSAVGNTACSPRPTVACCGHTVHILSISKTRWHSDSAGLQWLEGRQCTADPRPSAPSGPLMIPTGRILSIRNLRRLYELTRTPPPFFPANFIHTHTHTHAPRTHTLKLKKCYTQGKMFPVCVMCEQKHNPLCESSNLALFNT